jgi:hypothetical protein
MKLPIACGVAAVTLMLAGTAMAADTESSEATSGAKDSTLMIQTKKDAAVQHGTHKQNAADESKRGRPVSKAAPVSN